MIITYVGKEQCDILYYMIQIGIKLGKSIAVFDNSITHDLFSLFSSEENEDIVETKGIVVAKDYIIKREQQVYDYIFIYEGLYPRYTGYTDYAIIAPSYSKVEWDMIRDFVKSCEQMEIRNMLILRDKINNKVSDRVALAKLGFDPNSMITVEFNEKDYSSYISLLHNAKAKLQKNGEICEVVAVLCEELYGIKEKDFKNYV